MKMKKTQQYERVFNRFDENGDGKLSPQELKHRVDSMGEYISIEDAETAFMSVDSDGDGYLCLQDFIRLIEGGGPRGDDNDEDEEEERNNDLREAFKMYEVEEGGGGYINPKSLQRMLKRLGESKTIEECRKMIACFDLNGDGVLCFHEFHTMMSY